MLMEIANDLVRFFMVANIGVGLFVFVMAWRHQNLIVWDWMEEPDWRWYFGNIFSSALPEKFHIRRRQVVTLSVSFLASLGVQAFLSWLSVLTSKAAC